jgi:ELWxxDGT repeat protein
VDLAVTGAGGTQVFFNNGSGAFSMTLVISNLSGTSIALGDLDGDGDVDIVEGVSDEPDSVWFNGPAGTFTDSGMRLGDAGDGTNDLALDDLDGDGDLDLVAVYETVPPRRWMNRTTDGSATGKLYFVASDGIHGSEIWSLDGGTAARVTSLDNVNLSSSDDPPTVLGNDLVMRAWDVSASDYEPWVLHGETGEVEKLDLVANGSSNPQEFKVYRDRLFTSAFSGTDRWSLWKTDGSFSYIIQDYGPTTSSTVYIERSVQDMFLFDDTLFFIAQDDTDRDLHYYYETPPGTSPPYFDWGKVDINPSGPFDIYSYSKQAVAVSGSRLYIVAQESWIDQGYQELYTTSDPSTYASLVRDIHPTGYPAELHPESLVFFQGDLYFSANAAATFQTPDRGLWIYDGAQAPQLVTLPAGLQVEEGSLTPYNGKLFFVGVYPGSFPTPDDKQIWSYDGASTFESIHPNPSGSSFPVNLTVFRDRLYFRADDETEREPWWYDDVTVTLQKIQINPSGSSQSGPMTPWLRLIPD